MKYTVSMSSSRKKSINKKGRRPARKRMTNKGIGKFNRFKKFSGRKKKGKKIGGKGFLGIDKVKFRKFLYISLGVVFFLGCMSVLGAGLYLRSLRNSLPSPDELVDRSSDQSTRIYDRNGQLLYTVYGDQNREFVPLENIPDHTKWAILAAEDIEFYDHKGIDYRSIVMAAIQNLRAGRVVRGASTITQQLVKNTILYDVLGEEAYDQTYARKIKEVLITMQVEQTFTKDEILQMYLNEIALGGVNYGFQSGAKAYFDKDVSELTLAESAMLAGIINGPGIFSPIFGSNPELAETRQEFVFNQMLRHSSVTGVTEEEIEEAREEELVYATRRIDIKAPHFVFYVKNILEEQFGIDRVERGGLRVTTTLDYSIQEIAEEEIVKGVANASRYNVNNGSLVAIEPNTGDIVAMVGSVDYWNTEDPRVDGNVNIATSLRQMGSSVKPYLYLAAALEGYGPWTLAPDIEMSFGNYEPVNWDRKFHGLMTTREALVKSRNLSAVYTLQYIGIDKMINVAEKMGITTISDKADYGLSLALGSGEMKLLEHTAAFGVFANEGVKVDTASILKVEAPSGEVLFEKEEPKGRRVFDEKEIYAINYMLCDLGGHGDRPGGNAGVVQGKKVCHKTGTTNGPKDVLTMMYHPNLVVGVWGGNNNNEDMPRASGSVVPLRIVHSFTQRVADQYPVGTFRRPSGILSTRICKDTGRVAGDDTDCSTEASIYIQGRAPREDKREVVYICKENGLVPTNLEHAQNYDLVEKFILIESDIENSRQRSTYERFITSMKDSHYITEKPESGICPLPLGPGNAPVVEISSPTSGQEVSRGSNMTISGVVRVLESVDTFTVSIDGSPIPGASVNNDGTYSVTYSVPSDMSLGAHTVTVSVTDNQGKSDSRSVNFNVVNSTSPVTLNSPANGVNIAFPVNLSANVTQTPSSVQFFINKTDGTYTRTLGATQSGGSWVAVWDSTTGGNGNYTIKARAIIGGTARDSNTITVTY